MPFHFIQHEIVKEIERIFIYEKIALKKNCIKTFNLVEKWREMFLMDHINIWVIIFQVCTFL